MVISCNISSTAALDGPTGPITAADHLRRENSILIPIRLHVNLLANKYSLSSIIRHLDYLDQGLTLDLKDEHYRRCVLHFLRKPVKAITVVISIIKDHKLQSILNNN